MSGAPDFTDNGDRASDRNVCPECRGDVMVIGRRAWCVRPYHESGCGADWRFDGRAWRRHFPKQKEFPASREGRR